jgi:hypothetical protein
VVGLLVRAAAFPRDFAAFHATALPTSLSLSTAMSLSLPLTATVRCSVAAIKHISGIACMHWILQLFVGLLS